MITRYKRRFTIMILVAVLFLNGCGYKDIEKRFFVVSIGVDIAKDKTKNIWLV